MTEKANAGNLGAEKTVLDAVETDTTAIQALIGALNGEMPVPYSYGNVANTILAHLNTAYYHIHGTGFVYPNHADSVQLTAGAGAWDLTGAIAEVIPAGVLTVDEFDLHWLSVSGISGNGELQIDIYKGAALSEVLIGSVDAYRNAVQSQEGAKRIQIPQQESGERISCRVSDSTGGALTCNVKFNGHYYAG